jgi:hypothetical protein
MASFDWVRLSYEEEESAEAASLPFDAPFRLMVASIDVSATWLHGSAAVTKGWVTILTFDEEAMCILSGGVKLLSQWLAAVDNLGNSV